MCVRNITMNATYHTIVKFGRLREPNTGKRRRHETYHIYFCKGPQSAPTSQLCAVCRMWRWISTIWIIVEVTPSRVCTLYIYIYIRQRRRNTISAQLSGRCTEVAKTQDRTINVRGIVCICSSSRHLRRTEHSLYTIFNVH